MEFIESQNGGRSTLRITNGKLESATFTVRDQIQCWIKGGWNELEEWRYILHSDPTPAQALETAGVLSFAETTQTDAHD